MFVHPSLWTWIRSGNDHTSPIVIYRNWPLTQEGQGKQKHQFAHCVNIPLLAQRVIKVEPEEPRIFSNYRCCHYVVHIVISFLRHLLTILRDQLPEVAVARIGRQSSNKSYHSIFAPVIRSDYQ